MDLRGKKMKIDLIWVVEERCEISRILREFAKARTERALWRAKLP
jgi:hypothetical protein